MRTAITPILLTLTLAILPGCSGSSGPSRDDTQAMQQAPSRNRALATKLFNQASALHRNARHDEALVLYRESIEADNSFFASWNNMGQLLMDQRNYADAVSAFRVAADLQPSDPRPEYNIGLAYQTIGWGEESFAHFERALQRDPNYLPALRGVVRSAEMIGRSTPKVLDYIRTARLRETNDQWRDYFDRRQFLVEKQIEEAG